MSGGFFDFHKQVRSKRTAASASPGETDDAATLTPTELNRRVESTLKVHLGSTLQVRGEVSNFTRNRNSGHLYFTLKDSASSVDAVMWASRAEGLKFDPQDGVEVVAGGVIGVYTPRGRYQLVCSSLKPVGRGAAELAKRKLIETLTAEGLIDPARRRAIPMFPRRVLLVSSRQAAGLADMVKVFSRAPMIEVRLLDVPVQGPTSAERIAAAMSLIRTADAEVVIVARGGGSADDLAAFDDERVARAIAACPVPVVTGIGHEIDVSVSDLVADHHAHTPTEAATVVVRNWVAVAGRVAECELRMRRAVHRQLAMRQERLSRLERAGVLSRPAAALKQLRSALDHAESRVVRRVNRQLNEERDRLHRIERRLLSHTPDALIRQMTRQLDHLRHSLQQAVRGGQERCAARLKLQSAVLANLNPRSVLARGYSITTRKDGTVVRRRGDVQIGDVIDTQLADGLVRSTVDDERQGRLF
jgi:exodeoxyribonuclease VII large subunit